MRVNGDCIRSVTELCNVLAFCKSLADTASNSDTEAHHNYIDLACALLKRYISEDMESDGTDDSTVYGLLNFVIEPLELSQVTKSARKYSPTTITMAFLWQITSTALYTKLRTVFILPSVSRLRQLSRGSSVDTGL